MDKKDLIFKEEFLERYEGNPIIRPADYPGAEAIFNCAQTVYNGETILLCSVRPQGDERPYIQVARSKDGINFKFDEKPLIKMSEVPFIKGLDWWVIDPRITYFPEEDVYYIIRPGSSGVGTMSILGKTKDFKEYEDIEIIAMPENRVPCLFPEKINGMYYRLDRPYTNASAPSNEAYHANIWISESPDLIHWGRHRLVLKSWAHWNPVKIGPTPPIKTTDGWLEIIHGVSTGPEGQRYSLGAVLLDLNEPGKVIGKCNKFILTPDADYEYRGQCPGVVFSCGAIADTEEDRLRVYYGAADTSICLATGSLSKIIEECKRNK